MANIDGLDFPDDRYTKLFITVFTVLKLLMSELWRQRRLKFISF